MNNMKKTIHRINENTKKYMMTDNTNMKNNTNTINNNNNTTKLRIHINSQMIKIKWKTHPHINTYIQINK